MKALTVQQPCIADVEERRAREVTDRDTRPAIADQDPGVWGDQA